MEPQRYQSRPSEVWASEPLTPENRDEVWKWLARSGCWAQVLPDGYEYGLYIQTVQGTKVPVMYGNRVLFNPLHDRPDFWPIDPAVFEAKYELPGEAA